MDYEAIATKYEELAQLELAKGEKEREKAKAKAAERGEEVVESLLGESYRTEKALQYYTEANRQRRMAAINARQTEIFAEMVKAVASLKGGAA